MTIATSIWIALGILDAVIFACILAVATAPEEEP